MNYIYAINALFMCLPAMVHLQSEEMPDSGIKFEETSIRADQLVIGGDVVGTYILSNNSKSPVAVTVSNVPCSCLVVSVPQKPIDPGQKGEVALEFNGNGYEGEQVKNFEVLLTPSDSNIPARNIKLSLNSKILPWCYVYPRRVSWQVGEAIADRRLKIVLEPGVKLKSFKIDSSDFKIKDELSEIGEDSAIINIVPAETTRTALGSLQIIAEMNGKRLTKRIFLGVDP